MIIYKEERKPYGYWTKEKCKEESLKYSNRKEFKMLSKSAYAIVQRNGWSNELCGHMSYLGSLSKRFIYIYIFPDNTVYIGLTYNIDERNRNHLSGQCDSRVYDYIKLTGLIPKLEIITPEPIFIDDAVKMEIKLIEEYQNKKSHRVLNISLGGGLGGCKFFWTRERCQEEALKYNNRSDFKKFSSSSYNVSLKNYWLDELCEHMTEIVKPKGYWTIERCQEDALKYNTRNEFKNKSRSSYGAATKNNWLDDICFHMVNGRIKNIDNYEFKTT